MKLNLIINHTSMEPIYEQIIAQIKAEVIEGRMTAGDALPSVRALSRELKISALTVKKAYDNLEEEGLFVTVHGKGSFIAAANQEYNNSQMFHVMDEAEEHGEKIAEAAERNKPKTEEERKEEMVDEALGTEENKGMMSEIMDELSETTEEMTEQMTEKTVENMEELPDEVLQEQLVTDSLEAAEMVQTETIKRYVPIDIRV